MKNFTCWIIRLLTNYLSLSSSFDMSDKKVNIVFKLTIFKFSLMQHDLLSSI